MKFKFDENLASIGKSHLTTDGHDVTTVSEQGLNGFADSTLYEVCRDEMRVLVTLDRDFGEVIRFPPEATAGIVVIANPGRLSQAAIAARMAELAAALRSEPINRALWIVEPGRVRVHLRQAGDGRATA